jgi:hypothetical protein
MKAERLRILVAATTALSVATRAVAAAGPPVLLAEERGVDARSALLVRDAVSSRRSIRDDIPLPHGTSVSTERAAMEQRAASIRLALDRAKAREAEASWEECVREAAGAMSDAAEVLAKMGNFALLRSLHEQIGMCLTLAQKSADARPHFVAAALLDETPPKAGLHREEAEKAQEAVRAEVLARSSGRVRVETLPPGAEVWIDGRRAPGVTPLEVDVRLGDHYVTARRFRYETYTERTVLQPSGVVKIVLDPARRGTLRDQLAAVAGSPSPPGAREMLLARAIWSRAEQLVVVRSSLPRGLVIELFDASSGGLVRSASVGPAAADADVRRSVCVALGEPCERPARGIPWYVWPLGGVAITGVAIASGVLATQGRDIRFCPPKGCR